MSKERKQPLSKVISDFISLNSFFLLILIGIVAFHQVIVVGGTVSDLQDNQEKMIYYLKKNVSKVNYLTATGMVVTTSKSNVSLSDERIKSYIANEITETFFGGLIEISNNYKIKFATADDIVLKNKKINDFFVSFIKPNGNIISKQMRSLHRAILDKKYPEYIDVLSFEYEEYIVRKPSKETEFETVISSALKVTIIVKSWINELKEWDTREKTIRVPFEIIVNVDKYAKMDNGFGMHFKSLEIPIMHKPTASQVNEDKIK